MFRPVGLFDESQGPKSANGLHLDIGAESGPGSMDSIVNLKAFRRIWTGFHPQKALAGLNTAPARTKSSSGHTHPFLSLVCGSLSDASNEIAQARIRPLLEKANPCSLPGTGFFRGCENMASLWASNTRLCVSFSFGCRRWLCACGMLPRSSRNDRARSPASRTARPSKPGCLRLGG